MLSPCTTSRTVTLLLDVIATTCGPGECAAAEGGPAELRQNRFRVGPFWHTLSRFGCGSDWPGKGVLDGLGVPSTARFRCGVGGGRTSQCLQEATAELAVVHPEARGAAKGEAVLDAAASRKRPKSASGSSLGRRACIKDASAPASSLRVRHGPIPAALLLNCTRAGNRGGGCARGPSSTDDGFAGAMPKSKQPCEYCTQGVRLEERPSENQKSKRLSQNGNGVGRRTKHCTIGHTATNKGCELTHTHTSA